ncbi:MAG: hypothetical protein HQ523_15500 [Lentisphaerae bacterium]|nr:hypothetical protein [Lentisphaerota bacterium]
MTKSARYTFSDSQLQSGFIDDFRRWEAEDRGRLPLREAILCVGSSTMRLWKHMEEDLGPGLVINRGFGGSKMADALPFGRFFARYEAHKVVIYEGDNDLGDGDMAPETLLAQYRDFCAAIWDHRGDTQIYIISIKPSPCRWPLRDLYLQANGLLAALCASDERLTYINIEPVMLGADGTPIPALFRVDKLHMKRLGYTLWRDVIRPVLLPH